jgi:N-acetylmuramic acid 6-phosphate etherase
MDDSELDALLAKCNRSAKLSLLVAETGLTVGECQRDLDAAKGVLAKALQHRNRTLKSNKQDSGNRRLILSIDGGATKSAAVIVDEAGNVVGRGKAGACNL